MEKVKKAPTNGRVLNARPDAIDFRDKIYAPTLIEVPDQRTIADFQKVKVPILDQGLEGACTGFGLATVIHYLLRMKRIPSMDLVSPRMLYELAKKYDEWEGEDYIGSSARGAVKGWHKHGVCLSELWPYDQSNPDKELTPERTLSAAKFPLGAYYRVNHKDIVDIHTALAEVGVLFATCRVHDGWFADLGKEGYIPYEGQEVRGAHAFALIGFNQDGLWFQNSWGEEWGKQGFGLITYDDWLANGTDIWVARMGVPVYLQSPNSIAKSYSVASSVRDGLSFKELRPHVISLGNNGLLKTTGTYGNFPSDVERIFKSYIPEITKNWKNKRIMLYAHGGLVSESSVLQRLADFRQTLLAKEIYPIFFVWNTDLWSTVKNLLKDALSKRKPDDKVSSAFDFMLDRLDDGLEPLLRLPGRSAWAEMKENAFSASAYEGGATLALRCLHEYMNERQEASIHLVGHSAGSIFLAPMVEQLGKLGLEIESCTLWAPACTLDCFDQYYGTAIESHHIGSFNLYTLTEDAEQDDNCFRIYNKSLLYLVSNAFEEKARGTGILGMAKYISVHEKLQDWITNERVSWISSPNNLEASDASQAKRHGEFDNDVHCFRSTIARIIKEQPAIKFGDSGTVSQARPVDGAEAGSRAGAVPENSNVSEEPARSVAPSPHKAQVNSRHTASDFANRRQILNEIF